MGAQGRRSFIAADTPKATREDMYINARKRSFNLLYFPNLTKQGNNLFSIRIEDMTVTVQFVVELS